MPAAIHYRREIDGLRAVAVGSVILNHFNNAIIPSGYLGVDIFFVISGYVITLSLCGRESVSLKTFLLGFYARRFKRLMPALILCVAVTSVLTSLVNADPAASLKTGVAALFGLSNLYLLRIANDYFGGLSQLNSFTHTWSLGIEEQFYLLFPVILWLFLRRPGPAGIKIFFAIILVLAALSLVLFAVIGVHQPMAAFYLMPLRFWELAAGCLVAMNHFGRGRPQWIDAGPAHKLANGIVVLILATLFFPERLALVTNVTAVALTTAALVVLSPGSLAYRVLTSRIATYLGMVSYSLYLWHWPVLALSRYTIGMHGWSVPILVGLIFILADTSYRYVEKPLRTRSWAASSGGTVLWGGTAAGIAAVFVIILAVPLDGRLYAGRPAQLAARNIESLGYSYRIPETPYAWAGGKCILADNSYVARKIPLDACTLGEFDRAPRRVMVFGNSFAAAFVHSFDALVRDDHYAVTVTSVWGASPIGEVPNDSPWAQANAWYWDTLVPQMISRLRSGDRVLLMSDLAQYAPRRMAARDTRNLKLYEVGLRRLSAELDRAGVTLAVLDINPFIRDSSCRPDTALPQWFAPGGGPCKFLTRADTIARRHPVDAMLRQLEREHLLVVIDTLDVFCPGQTCTFVGHDDHVLYRDEFSHPSVEAARDAAPLFRHALTGGLAMK